MSHRYATRPPDTPYAHRPDAPDRDRNANVPRRSAVAVRRHATHEEHGVRVDAIECGSHTGTHVDAPAHTEPDGKTLEAYPIDRFVFDAVRVDCRDPEAREPIPPARVPEVDADLAAFWTG